MRPSFEEQPLLRKGHYNLVGLSGAQFWALILSCWCALFLNAMDGTIVSTLLGPISSSFRSSDRASWLGTSYLLATCCFSPVYAKLSDVYGRRSSMLIGLGIFAVGTVGCAAASSMEWMIAARAVAGLGGGGISAVSTTVLTDVVPLARRGMFSAYSNVLVGLGVALGPLLGGLLNDTLGWRVAFWVQLPIFVPAWYCNYLYLDYDHHPRDNDKAGKSVWEWVVKTDLLGCLLLALTLALALIPVSMLGASPGSDGYTLGQPAIFAPLGGSVITFVLLLFVELRFAREPILPFTMLRSRTAVSVSLYNFLASVELYAIIYTAPLYFMTVRQLTPTSAGQHLVFAPLFNIAGPFVTGFWVKRYGTYKGTAILCSLLSIAGLALMAMWSPYTPDHMFWWTYGFFLFGGRGSVPLTTIGLMVDVGPENNAIGTSLCYLSRNIGQLLGVTGSGLLIQHILASELPQWIPGPDKFVIIHLIRHSSASIGTLTPWQKAGAIVSYQMAINRVYQLCAGLAVLGTLTLFGMRGVDLHDMARGKAGDDDCGDVVEGV